MAGKMMTRYYPVERTDGREWTPELVRTDLPTVFIQWEGKPWQARVTGRANRFASVSPEFDLTDRAKYPRRIMGPIFHFAWETIAHAANSGKLLQA